MITVVFVIHILISLALVCLVLLQRSEGGALGMGGGGGGGGMMSSRSSANLMTRVTAVLAGAFMVTSLVLTMLAGRDTGPTSIFDQGGTPPAPIEAPAEPANPTVPIAQ